MVYEEALATSHDDHAKQHLRIVYTRQTRERQIFMQELKTYRYKKERKLFKEINSAVGPRWYQALSVPQTEALDNLESAIYQDLLEGRAYRTASIMRSLGLYPRPSYDDLMTCNYFGRNDPKEMLAYLYFLTFGYSIEGKRISYNLNAKLMLSGIFYLGLNNLIHLLREKFRPDIIIEKQPHKVKPKIEPPLASPYLQKMVAFLWEKPTYKRPPPPPLPNLDDLNDPYEEEPVVRKPPPPPPPPPPPKKRIPREVCDELAGFYKIEPHQPSVTDIVLKKPIRPSHRKTRISKANIPEGKKVYGLGLTSRKSKGPRRRKPVAPSTGLANAQYTINGVYVINNKSVYVLGNVSILPANGELIHGGYRYIGNHCVNIHCGYRGLPPASKADPCDCLTKWHDTVFDYVKKTKCYCRHYYDYGNEGTFPIDELPFFIKPTRYTPMEFNYQTIFNLDSKNLLVEKEFKKLWETDSILRSDTNAPVVKNEKKKKKKRSSNTCLGSTPKPEDYLRCALRFMRRVNVAARLPDLHLAPELKEWMRHRIYGPLTKVEKAYLLRKSTAYWSYFSTLAGRGYGHISPPKEAKFEGHTNWLHKQRLNEHFRRYTHDYKLAIYRSHAYNSNLLWRSMCQAEFPDKKFRQIFFSYLFGTLAELQIIQPYNSKEVDERKNIISQKRYICLPAGIDKSQ